MKTVIGVMGGGAVDAATEDLARRLGAAIAEAGWVLLTGGRDRGVMAAASAGARQAGGLVLGIQKTADTAADDAQVDIMIRTGMGEARNLVNVLSSHVVVALAGGPGTLSEVALAVKTGRPVILLGFDDRGLLGDQVVRVDDVDAAMAALRQALGTTP